MNGLDKLWNAWREELSILPDPEIKTIREKYTGIGVTEQGILYLTSDEGRIFRPLDPDLLKAVQNREGDDALYQTAAKALHAYPMKTSAEIAIDRLDPTTPAAQNLARRYHIIGSFLNDDSIQVHLDVAPAEAETWLRKFFKTLNVAFGVEQLLRGLRGEVIESLSEEVMQEINANRDQSKEEAKIMLIQFPEIAQYIEDVDPSLKDVLKTPGVNETYLLIDNDSDAEVRRI